MFEVTIEIEAVLKCVPFVSKDADRAMLGYVHITGDVYVATEGKRMIVYKPANPVKMEKPVNVKFTPACVQHLRKISREKHAPKYTEVKIVFEDVSEDDGEKKAVLIGYKQTFELSAAPDGQEGKYPSWWNTFPSGDPEQATKSIMVYNRLLSSFGGEPMTFVPYGESAPILIYPATNKWIGLCMPLNGLVVKKDLLEEIHAVRVASAANEEPGLYDGAVKLGNDLVNKSTGEVLKPGDVKK
jgi:hypothetical protein